MIRHASRGLALAPGARAILMIEAALLRLLMTAVGVAMLNPAGEPTTDRAAIDLAPLARAADVEDPAAIGRRANASPEGSVLGIGHVKSRLGWTAETEGGTMRAR
jgi:hypothetical protein